jgi:Rieske 2Fe-2S family protein
MQLGLEANWLTSREVFDQESKLIFAQDWLCLGRRQQLLPEAGFATAAVEGRELLLLCDQEHLRAFHNVCRHRGAVLTTAPHGKLVGGCITCPYHAWRYDAGGHLKHAPNLGESGPGNYDQLGLSPLACAEVAGFVLVNLSSRPQPLPQWLLEFAQRLEAWELGRLKVAATLEYLVEANWKLLFQNYSECYHCPTVHPLLSRWTSFRSAANDVLSGPVLGGPMHLEAAAETLSLDGKFAGQPFPGLDATQRRQAYFYTVFPTIFVSAHPDYVLLHYLTRLDVNRTRVTCEFLVRPEALAEFQPQRAVEFWDVTNRQDWQVSELVQRGASSPGYRPGPYSPFESLLPRFDQYYRSRLCNAGDEEPNREPELE